jgi:hypothetical protein
MTALAGLVSLAPLALGSSSLWQAEGGNYRMFEAALQGYATVVSKGAKVLEVAKAEGGGGYRLLVQSGGRWVPPVRAELTLPTPSHTDGAPLSLSPLSPCVHTAGLSGHRTRTPLWSSRAHWSTRG